jgi:hypothetical protein
MMYGLGRFKSFFYYGNIKKNWSKIILDHNANACIIFLVNMSTTPQCLHLLAHGMSPCPHHGWITAPPSLATPEADIAVHSQRPSIVEHFQQFCK